MASINNVTGAIIDSVGTSNIRTTLNAVTTGAAAGSTNDLGAVCTSGVAACTSSAALTDGTNGVILEGSLDGTNWFLLVKGGTLTADFAAAKTVPYFVTGKPFRYCRAIVGTEAANVFTLGGAFTGGTLTVMVSGG